MRQDEVVARLLMNPFTRTVVGEVFAAAFVLARCQRGTWKDGRFLVTWVVLSAAWTCSCLNALRPEPRQVAHYRQPKREGPQAQSSIRDASATITSASDSTLYPQSHHAHARSQSNNPKAEPSRDPGTGSRSIAPYDERARGAARATMTHRPAGQRWPLWPALPQMPLRRHPPCVNQRGKQNEKGTKRRCKFPDIVHC